MEVPAGTIKTYLYRARRELAARLAAAGWDGAWGVASGAVETADRDDP